MSWPGSSCCRCALSRRGPRRRSTRPRGSDALTQLYGTSDTVETDRIRIKAPDIAENGAIVPITVRFDIPDAEYVGIIAENNPAPLTAAFELSEHSGGLVSTRIKMGETSPVHAVIKAGDTVYRATKEVKVTIGGCGG